MLQSTPQWDLHVVEVSCDVLEASQLIWTMCSQSPYIKVWEAQLQKIPAPRKQQGLHMEDLASGQDTIIISAVV